MGKGRLSRPDALRELERVGIQGRFVYLIDVLPLVEMMWADGDVQDREWGLLREFVHQHVDSINQLARTTVLSHEDGEAFVARYQHAAPDGKAMDIIRAMIPPVRLQSSDQKLNKERTDSIIEWCLDIGAACVTDYPYEDRERFQASEKECLLKIVASLCPSA